MNAEVLRDVRYVPVSTTSSRFCRTLRDTSYSKTVAPASCLDFHRGLWLLYIRLRYTTSQGSSLSPSGGSLYSPHVLQAVSVRIANTG